MDRFAGLPAFAEFSRVADPEAYAPLPKGWVLGLTDVVRSTDAIGEGRYKAVNMAGAAAIAAVMNALGTRQNWTRSSLNPSAAAGSMKPS